MTTSVKIANYIILPVIPKRELNLFKQQEKKHPQLLFFNLKLIMQVHVYKFLALELERKGVL